MGVAYNSVYLVWFEVGRTEWMRAGGLPYRSVEERGISLPVVEAALRFRSAAHYDDLLEIETQLEELRSRRVTFTYRIWLADRCLAEGSTVHVPVERESGRSARLPDWLMDALAEREKEV
jgi:acyl-CoA thioester hydrolase